MADADWAENHLVVICGNRRKPWFNMSRTTTRQEFIRQMYEWLGDEFPRDYAAFYYDKRFKKMIQLDDNEEYYLASIFDSISFENQTIGVQPILVNDISGLELFISIKDSSISHLSSEAFAGNESFTRKIMINFVYLEQFQIHMDQLTAEGLNSTTIADSLASENSSWSLLNNDLSNKDLLDSNHDTNNKHFTPTTNIQFQLIDHIGMIHDVCSTLKRVNYVSNLGKNGKSKLAYLSGVRGPNDRGKQIRPILRVSILICLFLNNK